MRKKCLETQRRIHDQDKIVTTLTREVKMGRKQHWDQMMSKCEKERELDSICSAHAEKLRQRGELGDEDLSQAIIRKQEELCAAKQLTKTYSRQCRRFDAELQEQFRGEAEMQKVLSKHPAGEVFLLRHQAGEADSDNDSNDMDYLSAARRGEVQLASSDEEGEGSPLAGGLGGGKPPPPPSQQWRSVVNHDDESYASDATSVTSPSGSSGGMPSPTSTPLAPAGAGDRSKAFSGGQSPKAPSDTKSSPYSSDDEKAAAGAAAPKAAAAAAPATSVAEVAPKAKPTAVSDILGAAEVSSEEHFSEDSFDEASRSV